MTALVVVLAVAVALLALLMAGLLRSHAEILRILHSLGVTEDEVLGGAAPGDALAPVPGTEPPGRTAAPAADITGTTPGGGAKRIGVVAAGHTTLLAFLSTGCQACRPFWDGPGDLALPGADPRLVFVTKGPEAESQAAVAALAAGDIPLVMSSDAFARYTVPATPYFVLVDGRSGRITGEGTATTWTQLAGLLGRATADAGHASARRRRRFADRMRDTDAELAVAGIEPGDPSLYPGSEAR